MPFTEVSTNIILVIIGIGSLVLIHELGHFLAAKKIGVRVHIFSLGFGPPLLRKTWGETEYRLSLVPLGGYVKLAGEYPVEGVPREPWDFLSKTPSQRAFVLTAGVALNALLAFLVFVIAFRIGVPFVTSEIGELTPGWPAWEAGLRSGDKIIEIEAKTTRDFEDVFTAIALSTARDMPLKVERGGKVLDFLIKPRYDPEQGIQRIGITPALSQEIGKIMQYADGAPAKEAGLRVGDKIIAINGEAVNKGERVLEIEFQSPGKGLNLTVLRDGEEKQFKVIPLRTTRWMLGISCASTKIKAIKRDGLASKIGLEKGDEVVQVEGQEATGWATIKDLVEKAQGKTLRIRVKRQNELRDFVVPLDSPQAREEFLDGLFPAIGLKIDHVVEGFPAEKLGIRPGDELLSLGGETLKGWEHLLRLMATSEGKETKIQWRRDNQTFSESFHPMKDEKGALGRIGIRLKEKSEIQKYGLLGSCQMGSYKALIMIQRIYLTLRGLFTQKVSTETVGGIIMIAQATYESAKLGLGKLLYFIGILSLQLAILNALPVPALDGGHLFFLGIEKLKGSPLSERTMAIAQYIGIALLLSLVIYATRNDILRIFMMHQ